METISDPCAWWAARTCALSCPAARFLTHFVSDVDLAEAEGAEVGVGRLHGRLHRLAEELLHHLADVGPHLSDRLRGRKRDTNSNPEERLNIPNPVANTAYHSLLTSASGYI